MSLPIIRTVALKIMPPKLGVMTRILRGERQAAIVLRRPDIMVGDILVLYCVTPPFAVETSVDHVRHCTVGDLTPEELKQEGHTHVGNYLGSLQPYGPHGLGMELEVTVVRWGTLHGLLANQADRFELEPSMVVRQSYQRL